jgi:hypothetical protein
MFICTGGAAIRARIAASPYRDAAFDLQRLEKLSQGVSVPGGPTYHVNCLIYRMICLYWRGIRALNGPRIQPRFDLTMIPKFNSSH